MKLTKGYCQSLSDEAVVYLAPMACMVEVRKEHIRREKLRRQKQEEKTDETE